VRGWRFPQSPTVPPSVGSGCMGAAAGFAQKSQPRQTTEPSGVYRPRRPQASPLYRLIEDYFDDFCTVYDEASSKIISTSSARYAMRASRAAGDNGARSSARWSRSSRPARFSSTVSRVCVVILASMSSCWHFPASAATSVPVAMPSGSRCGESGSRIHAGLRVSPAGGARSSQTSEALLPVRSVEVGR